MEISIRILTRPANYITVDQPAFFRVNGKQPLFHYAQNVVVFARLITERENLGT